MRFIVKAAIAAASLCGVAQAMTAYDAPFQVINPLTGALITLQAEGDENGYVLRDADEGSACRGCPVVEGAMPGAYDYGNLIMTGTGPRLQSVGVPVGQGAVARLMGVIPEALQAFQTESAAFLASLGQPSATDSIVTAQSVQASAPAIDTTMGLGMSRREAAEFRRRMRRQTGTTITINNLVLMIRFKGHETRPLPAASVYWDLFNKNGVVNVTDAGCVQDVWLRNSFNRLKIVSTVTGWIQIDQTELATSPSSLTSTTVVVNGPAVSSAIVKALNELNKRSNLNGISTGPVMTWSNFDTSPKDGVIDMITVIHSGYAAEKTELAADGTTTRQRIWSHKGWLNPPSGMTNYNYTSRRWASPTGKVGISAYNINNGLAGVSGFSICNIGVIAHELGHYLNLPDLYASDSKTSGGLGNWDIMGSAWGWSMSQKIPAHLSAYSKMKMGWLTPKNITALPGVHKLRPSATFADACRINLRSDQTEYLLIENRQPLLYDREMPAGTDGAKGGLIVYHVDERMVLVIEGEKHISQPDQTKYGGYPGATNWPYNNVHYRVAVLAADGLFEAEKLDLVGNKDQKGDGDDLYRKTHKGTTGLTEFTTPDTNAYQLGALVQKYFRITNIVPSGSTDLSYNFTLSIGKPANGCAGTADPCNAAAVRDESMTVSGLYGRPIVSAAKQGGICIPGTTSTAFTCKCNPGWSGTNCKTREWCKLATDGSRNPCGRYGTCALDPTTKLGFKCTCQAGWTGRQCQIGVCKSSSTAYKGCTMITGYVDAVNFATKRHNFLLPDGAYAVISKAWSPGAWSSRIQPNLRASTGAYNLPVAPKWSATQSFQLGGSWAGAIAASSRWQIQVFANGGTGYYEIMVLTAKLASAVTNVCSATHCPTTVSNGCSRPTGHAFATCLACKGTRSGELCEVDIKL